LFAHSGTNYYMTCRIQRSHETDGEPRAIAWVIITIPLRLSQQNTFLCGVNGRLKNAPNEPKEV